MSVARLRDELTQDEFAQWTAFYAWRRQNEQLREGGRRGRT